MEIDQKTDMTSLCKSLTLDSGTITPTTKRLEKNGFIHRKRNIMDERKIEFEITDKGKNLKRQFNKFTFEIIDNLDYDDIKYYIDIIKTFAINTKS